MFFATNWFLDPFYWIASGDIQRICQVAEDFDSEAYEDPAMGAMDFALKIENATYSRHTKEMMKALHHADPEQKFELFKLGALEVGATIENCDALKTAWSGK